jgi:hypothetical protein
VLSGFESFLAAVVGERLAARPGLAVAVTGAPPAPAAGAAVLQLGVSEAAHDNVRGFSPGDVLPPVNDPAAIRAVPLQATVTATLTRRATAATDLPVRTARAIALADVTVLLQSLDEADVRDGRALTSSAPDPGYRVLEFALGEVTIAPPADDIVQVTVTYSCSLFVWTPGTTSDGGVIDAVDALIEAQPLTVVAAPAIIITGGSAQVGIAGVSGTRLTDPDTGAREALQIAVGVHSELPPADRGTIEGGVPAALTGFRAFTVTQPQTTITYAAPAGPLGTVRSEEVLVHLAVPSDGPVPGVGVRLGSLVVALREAP